MIEKLDIINERPVKTVKIVDAGDYSITKKRQPLPSVAKIKNEAAKDQPSSVAEKTSWQFNIKLNVLNEYLCVHRISLIINNQNVRLLHLQVLKSRSLL